MMPMIVEMCPCSALICSLNAQVNVELLTIDKRTFTTDEGLSLQTLFGENSEGSAQYRAEVSTIASRLATVFASLKVCLYSCHASNTARTCRKGTCQISQPAMRGIIVLHREFEDSQTSHMLFLAAATTLAYDKSAQGIHALCFTMFVYLLGVSHIK